MIKIVLQQSGYNPAGVYTFQVSLDTEDNDDVKSAVEEEGFTHRMMIDYILRLCLVRDLRREDS